MLVRVFALGVPMVGLTTFSANADTNLDAHSNTEKQRLAKVQNRETHQPDDLVASFDKWLQTQDSVELQKLPDELSSVLQWFADRYKDEEQIEDLKETIERAKSLLLEKQIALTNVQQKIALLKLNPKQLAEVEKYTSSAESMGRLRFWEFS